MNFAFPQNKKIMVLAAAVLAVVVAIFALSSMLMDVDKITQPLQQHVLALTGQDMAYDDAKISAFGGGVTLTNIAIFDGNQQRGQSFLIADKLVLKVGLAEMLGVAKPEAIRIELHDPEIRLKRTASGSGNWIHLLQANISKEEAPAIVLTLVNGRVIYQANSTDTVEIDAISGRVRTAAERIDIKLQYQIDQKPYTTKGFCAVSRLVSLSEFDAQCELEQLQVAKSLAVKGRVIASQKGVQSRFSATGEQEDVAPVLALIADDKAIAFTRAVPFKGTIDGYVDPQKLLLNVSQASLRDMTGSAKIRYMGGGAPSLTVEAAIDHLVFDSWMDMLGAVPDAAQKNNTLNEPQQSELTGSVSATIRSMDWMKLNVTNATLKANIQNGQLAITDSKASLPNNGGIVVLGRIESTPKGLEYNGLVEFFGDSMQKLLPLVGLDNAEIGHDLLSRYRGRFNIIATPAVTTLSELRLVAGNNIRVAGGVSYASETEPNLTGGLMIRGIDLEPLRKVWLGSHHLLKPVPVDTAANPFAFEWLKQVKTTTKFKLELGDYRVLAFNGGPTRLVLAITPGKLELEDIQATLDDTTIDGRIELEVGASQTKPKVISRLAISYLNMGDTFMPSVWAQQSGADNLSVWSEDVMHFYPLSYFDGYHEISVGQLDHSRFKAENIRADFSVTDSILSAKELTMDIWGGQMHMSLLLDARNVPELTVNIVVQNAQIQKLLRDFTGQGAVGGLAALSGKLLFNGINFNDWITNVTGTMAFNGRNIMVQRFNLPAMIRTIGNIRSIASLPNSVSPAFESGVSRFAEVTGVAKIERSSLSFSDVNFSSNEAVGTITGAYDLSQWRINLRFDLGLIALAQSGYPKLGIQLTGPINTPTRYLDLKSIEAYLAQRLN